MKTTNTLIMKLKPNTNLDNVYPNEEYVFFISNLKSIKNPNIDIETDIATNINNVDLEIISIKENQALVKDKEGKKEWFTFINEDGISKLYLSELKNNHIKYQDDEGHFDIFLKNVDIIENFEVVEITV